MIIDANMYWVPEKLFKDSSLLEAFLRSVPRASGMHAYENVLPESGKKQIVIEKPQGHQNLNYVEGQYTLETQLNDMDEAGVDQAILKLPGCQEWLPLELCRTFNDGMAEHVKCGNGRFHALAVVPPWGTKECLYELERCVHELGMTGVQLSAHYKGLYLDAEAFRPFFKRLNELELPAYIHHTAMPVQYDSLLDYNNLRRFYGRCADQMTAVGRELFSGMFDECPNVKCVHSMLGGAFFSYMNLLLPKRSVRKEEVSRFQTDTEKLYGYLQNNMFFEVSHAEAWGKALLECAIHIVGADHILFGTSYPVKREWLLNGPEFIRNLDIETDEKALILAENAERIYDLYQQSTTA